MLRYSGCVKCWYTRYLAILPEFDCVMQTADDLIAVTQLEEIQGSLILQRQRRLAKFNLYKSARLAYISMSQQLKIGN